MCYFGEILEHPEEVVEVLAHHLNDPAFGRVDAVVGTGLSGTLPLIPLRMRTGTPVAIVRKEDIKSHGSTIQASGDIPFMKDLRYVIIDDFVCTGRTLNRIAEQLGCWGECVGVLLYQSDHGIYKDEAEKEGPLVLQKGLKPEVLELVKLGGARSARRELGL